MLAHRQASFMIRFFMKERRKGWRFISAMVNAVGPDSIVIEISFLLRACQSKKCRIWREKHVIQREIIYVFVTHADDFANQFLRIAFLSFLWKFNV